MKMQITRFLASALITSGMLVCVPASAQDTFGVGGKSQKGGATRALNTRLPNVGTAVNGLGNRGSLGAANTSGVVSGLRAGGAGHANSFGSVPGLQRVGGNGNGNVGGRNGNSVVTGPALGKSVTGRLNGVGGVLGSGGKLNDALRNARDASQAAAAGHAQFESPFQRNTPESNLGTGPKAPDMSLGEGEFGGRELNNPLDRSRNSGNGRGMNIRENASEGRRGNESRDRPMSSFGRSLATAGPRSGRVQYSNSADGRGAYSETSDGGFHTTNEHRDPNGRTLGYTDFYMRGNGASGPQSHTTDLYDENGGFISSETVTEYEDGSSTTKFVDSDGHVTLTTRDANGQTTQTEIRDDRSPSEGASLGGPVNGTGKGVGETVGMSRLDLLRQKLEGQSGNGGSNTMLHGRLGSNQVRPVGESGISLGGPKQGGINISTNPEESVRGGNNTTGGGDRPD